MAIVCECMSFQNMLLEICLCMFYLFVPALFVCACIEVINFSVHRSAVLTE